MGEEQPLRIFNWIVPRVNSTALTKCMGFVDDTVVWMEPYMGAHLNANFLNPEFKKGDPLAEKLRERYRSVVEAEVVQKFLQVIEEEAAKYDNMFPQEIFTWEWIKEQLQAPEPGKKFIFIKDQAYAIIDHLNSLPENVPVRHTFLINHPRVVYTSWKNIVTSVPSLLDKMPWDECHAADDACHVPVPEFFQIQHKLWKHVKEHLDSDPIIIDGYDLISNPGDVLRKFFEKLGIPFKESYLEWSGDADAVFSSWKGSSKVVMVPAFGPMISQAVHSTRFEPPKRPWGVPNPDYKITDEIKGYIEGAMPFYEEMYAHRLT